jgi:predicted TIM-barrel fold metal-dependent hydrolase
VPKHTEIHDAEGARLPIKLDSTSNGEYLPLPLRDEHVAANHRAHTDATRIAKRTGIGRRQFMVSASGAATTLLAFNAAYAQAGKTGGFYDIDQEAAFDVAQAEAAFAKPSFVLDVQGHFVNPEGAWLNDMPPSARPLKGMPKASCDLGSLAGDRSYLNCLGADEFVKDVFLDSDTDIMVLTFVPSLRNAEPLTIEEAHATRDIVERLDGTKRMLIHGRVNPNQDGDLQGMDELAEHWKVSAWKTYTQWGPDGKGFSFMDDTGQAFIEKARKLGITNICVHKGLPFGPQSYEHSLCDDIGPAAKQNPDMNFLIYHSGYVADQPEGPYNPDRNEGIDSLIKSVLENDVAKQGNVYAELGSTWRLLMRDPDSAAHSLGKLFKYLGSAQVLWGTDSIWYGSPQDQIQAFQTFQISNSLREKYDYAEITSAVRQQVFGLNAAPLYGITEQQIAEQVVNDRVAKDRLAYQGVANPHFKTHGPKNRREFMNLLRLGG